MHDGPRRPIAIVGPTASGKTGLAIAVAEALDGEIISMDSRQAYAGFEVGTAAPTAAERARVPHHGVGFLEPELRYGAGRFCELASRWMAEIGGRGAVPILAGGTGLFLRALTHPMFREPPSDPRRRRALRGWLDDRSRETLVSWAERLDPEAAERGIDAQRAARTIELALLSGRPWSWWLEHGEPEREPLRAEVFALEVPGEELKARIERRVAGWLSSGAWQEEVRRLRDEGLHGSTAFDALGYREVLEVVRGERTRASAREEIVRATWAYARRQRTWFRHQLPGGTVRLDGMEPTEQLARRVVSERDGSNRAP